MSAQAPGQLRRAFTALGYEPSISHLSSYETEVYEKWSDSGVLDRFAFLMALDADAEDSLCNIAQARLNDFYATLEAKKIEEKTFRQQVNIIKREMRKRFFKDFMPRATPLQTFIEGAYSSFSACGLYAIVFDYYHIPYQIWADAMQAVIVADPFRKFGTPVEIQEVASEEGLPLVSINAAQQIEYLRFLVLTGIIKESDVQQNKFDELFYKYYLPMEDVFFHEFLGMMYLHNGMIQMRQGKVRESISQLEKAFMFRPSYAIKYQLYRARATALKEATFGNWRELEDLIHLYQLLPGPEMRQLVFQSFVSITREYLHKRDSLQFYTDIFNSLTTQLEDSSLHRQLGFIYYQERAQQAAQQEQYPAALEWMARVDSVSPDVELRVAMYTGLHLTQLETCQDQIVFIDNQSERFPFLNSRADVMDTRVNCELKMAEAHFKSARTPQGEASIRKFEELYSRIEGLTVDSAQLVSTYQSLTRHYQDAGKPEKARALIRKAMQLMPQNEDLQNLSRQLE